MTQAAVSYQIKLLEERLGLLLFVRQPRQVTLTSSGRRLSAAATEAFDTLRNAFAAVRADTTGVLTISAAHAFASNWLGPRLGGFQLAHPTLAVRLSTSDQLVDFARDEVDAAIRHGTGPWPGLAMHRLFPVRFTPLCSPELLRRAGPLAKPADLLRLPLLSPADIWWQRWFALAGVAVDDLEARPGIRLDFAADRRACGGGRPRGGHPYPGVVGPGVAVRAPGPTVRPRRRRTARATGWSIPRRAATSRRSAPGATGCSTRSSAPSRSLGAEGCRAGAWRLPGGLSIHNIPLTAGPVALSSQGVAACTKSAALHEESGHACRTCPRTAVAGDAARRSAGSRRPRPRRCPISPASAGTLLVAEPDLDDPNFDHTVVLMLHHDAEGALGLVVNRPYGTAPTAELLRRLGQGRIAVEGETRLFYGGPVQPEVGMTVHSADYARRRHQAGHGGHRRHQRPRRPGRPRPRPGAAPGGAGPGLCRLGAGPARERAGARRLVHAARRSRAGLRPRSCARGTPPSPARASSSSSVRPCRAAST